MKGLLRRAEGFGRFVVGVKGNSQVVMNINTMREPKGGFAEIVDGRPEVLEREVRTAAEIVRLAVLRRRFHDAIQPRKRLIGLVAR